MVYSTLTRKNVCGQITEEFYVDEAYDTVGKEAFKKPARKDLRRFVERRG